MTKPYGGKVVSNAEFARLWADPAHTTASIGALLGIQPSAVGQRAAARGLPNRRWRSNLERRKATVEAIMPMWQANVAAVDIGRHFNCHQDTITKIMLRAGHVRPRKGARLPLADWYEMQLGARMAAEAAITKGAMRDAEMVEPRLGRRPQAAA